ncbi:MAG: hypothetical protein AAFR26_02915 [Cyanobacteria bacterium J06626_4]
MSIALWRDHSAVKFLIKILVSLVADTDSVEKPAIELAIKGLAAL